MDWIVGVGLVAVVATIGAQAVKTDGWVRALYGSGIIAAAVLAVWYFRLF